MLTYKRTHVGDPSPDGVFGIADCMGIVRGYEYDAVIGIGGIGAEARRFRINGKITWIGISPEKRYVSGLRGPLVTFRQFIFFDSRGPPLHDFAPELAARMYMGKVRYLLNGYSARQLAEAGEIVEWARNVSKHITGEEVAIYKRIKMRCICRKRPTKSAA